MCPVSFQGEPSVKGTLTQQRWISELVLYIIRDHHQTSCFRKEKWEKRSEQIINFKSKFLKFSSCVPTSPPWTTQLPHIPVSGAVPNPSLGELWPFRCHRSSGSVPGVPLTVLGMGRCAHKKLLQNKTKQKDQPLPDQVIYLPSGEAWLFFAVSFWTGIELCILTESVGNKTFSDEGRNSKFLKITVKSISKQTRGVVFSHLPFLFFPEKAISSWIFPKMLILCWV